MLSPKYIQKNPSPYTDRTTDGIPFRQGGVPIKVSEMEDLSLSGDFVCKIFNLSDPEDMKEYQSIMDQVINRALVLYGPARERAPQFNPQTGNFVVLLRWVKVFAEVPRYILDQMER